MSSGSKTRSQGHKLGVPSGGSQTDTLEDRIKKELTALGLLEPSEVSMGVVSGEMCSLISESLVKQSMIQPM